jgi:hypothetical protein
VSREIAMLGVEDLLKIREDTASFFLAFCDKNIDVKDAPDVPKTSIALQKFIYQQSRNGTFDQVDDDVEKELEKLQKSCFTSLKHANLMERTCRASPPRSPKLSRTRSRGLSRAMPHRTQSASCQLRSTSLGLCQATPSGEAL